MKKEIFIISLIILILDQISKIIVNMYIKLNSSILIIRNFFYLRNVYNEGAAFSILEGNRLLFIIIGLISIYLIYSFIKDFNNNKRNIIVFGLLLGGILGNLLDRIFLGYVRDFLDFYIFNYNFPVFNIADSAIFIGVVLLLMSMVKEKSNGSNSTRKR